MKVLTLILTSVLTLSVFAEYRVYQYHIKSRNIYSFDQKSYIVTSNLDPVSYLAYHGGEGSLKIDLLRTWVCYGQTSGRNYCNPPIESKGDGASP
jgi:hypothetical protein